MSDHLIPKPPAGGDRPGQQPPEAAGNSLLRQAGRAAVLSLAGTPALVVAALVERWITTR